MGTRHGDRWVDRLFRAGGHPPHRSVLTWSADLLEIAAQLAYYADELADRDLTRAEVDWLIQRRAWDLLRGLADADARPGDTWMTPSNN